MSGSAGPFRGSDVLLRVRGLTVTYRGGVRAVDGLDLTARRGGCLGVVGESGSGKSTMTRVLLGVADDADVTGSVTWMGTELVGLDGDAWSGLRWRRIAWAPQQTGALNPTLAVGEHIAEVLRVRRGLRRGNAAASATALLGEFGLAADRAARRPHELSGGQRRLVLAAQAFACDPDLVVLDEPTAGLDPLARARLVEVLRRRKAQGTTLVICTHDIDLLHQVADDVAVMYRGWLAESGPAPVVLRDAASPYGWALLNAVGTLSTLKELRGIRAAPDPAPEACPFSGRCTQEIDACTTSRPPQHVVRPGARPAPDHVVQCHRGGRVTVLEARGLRHRYPLPSGRLGGSGRPALDGVDLRLRSGEVLGIAGSNGAGKSTLALALTRLVRSEGEVLLHGEDLDALAGARRRTALRTLQLVQQDPFEAVSPRLRVREVLREPILLGGGAGGEDARIERALGDVRLPSTDEFLSRRAHQLSGGQLQRLSVARALVVEPTVLLLDEPVAMLDPSEAAELLHLLKAAQTQRGLAMVLISHDLAMLLRIADRIAVLDGGVVVEEGTGAELYQQPRAPLTRALLGASAPAALDAVPAPELSVVEKGH